MRAPRDNTLSEVSFNGRADPTTLLSINNISTWTESSNLWSKTSPTLTLQIFWSELILLSIDGVRISTSYFARCVVVVSTIWRVRGLSKETGGHKSSISRGRLIMVDSQTIDLVGSTASPLATAVRSSRRGTIRRRVRSVFSSGLPSPHSASARQAVAAEPGLPNIR